LESTQLATKKATEKNTLWSITQNQHRFLSKTVVVR